MKTKSNVLARQWLTYASFYLCRVNFAIIAPILMLLLGFSVIDIGYISTGLLAAYAIGQFINGQLADKYAKKLISVGMFGSSLMNILMVFAVTPITMFVLWTFNGFFQSMGWSSSVKITANWFTEKERGKASGILGTSYQIGNVISWLLAGFIVATFGWQMGFLIPAMFFAINGIHWTLKGKQSPEDEGKKTIENYSEKKDTHIGFKQTLRKTLLNWRVWAGGFALFFLNIIRYGFLTWAPVMLFELDPNITGVALKALLFPLFGSLGALTMGFASKKISIAKFGVLSSLALTALMLIYPSITIGLLGVICMAGLGFFTYASHSLTVTRLPMLLGTRKASASVTGFIDMMGYIGATITGIATALLYTTGGWNFAFSFWAIGAFTSAIPLALLWNYKKQKEKYE